MRDGKISVKRVFGIDPATRGFGFAVLEGPEDLLDWGVRETRSGNEARLLAAVSRLIDTYQPDVVVLEDVLADGSRRCQRVRRLILNIRVIASSKRLAAVSCSRNSVREAFARQNRRVTKYQIATAIAGRFRELAPRLPPLRKPWMSEDYRMAIFDAAALALTFYAQKNAGISGTISVGRAA